ncbi:MAG: prepilin peptidase, partial [Solobacterium sp.]|nr:prepilin peptidase [Solobacterium sp.]
MNLSDSIFLVICVSVFLFITGTVFGSFITCTAYRIAAGEDWTKGRSHCDNCGHVLNAQDLVPVLSYLFLKGKCRYCGTKIPPDSTIVEILTGILFVLMFLKDCTLDLILLRNLILVVLCIGLSLVDLQKYIIPDGFVLAGIVNWAVFGIFSSDWKAYYLSG